MVVVITLFIPTNAAFYIVLPLDVLQSIYAVAMIISTPIDATVDCYSLFVEIDGPRLSAMNFVDVQIQPSSQVSCVFRDLGPRTRQCFLQVDWQRLLGGDVASLSSSKRPPNLTRQFQEKQEIIRRGEACWTGGITASVVPATQMCLCRGQPSRQMESMKLGFYRTSWISI